MNLQDPLKAFETARSRAVKYIDLCETLVNLKEDQTMVNTWHNINFFKKVEYV